MIKIDLPEDFKKFVEAPLGTVPVELDKDFKNPYEEKQESAEGEEKTDEIPG